MKTNTVEHYRWCLWNKSRLQIFRIRNRRRRIRRISRQNKYEKSLAGYFCSDTGVTTLRPASLVQFIFSLKTATMRRRIGRLMGELALFAWKISLFSMFAPRTEKERKGKRWPKSWIFSPFAFRLLPSTFRFDSSFFLSLSFFLERKESREPIECLVTVFKVRVEFRRLLRGQNGRMFGIEIDPYFPRYTQNKFYALNDQRQDYIRIQDLKRYRNENYFISVSENVFEYNCIRTASPSKRKFFCSRDSKKRSNDALESN